MTNTTIQLLLIYWVWSVLFIIGMLLPVKTKQRWKDLPFVGKIVGLVLLLFVVVVFAPLITPILSGVVVVTTQKTREE